MMKFRPKDRCARPHAFTLIEVLIVIAVIAILAALLVAGVSKIKSTASSAACISNLRQVAMANNSYASEHMGRIAAQGGPDGTGTDWRLELRPYLMPSPDMNVVCDVFVCRGDPDKGRRGSTTPVMMNQKAWRSYAVNYFMKNKNNEGVEPGKPKRMLEIASASKTIYISDAAWWTRDANYIEADKPASLDMISKEWHGGHANAAFLDGHCESLKIETLYPGMVNNGAFNGTR